MYIKKVFWKDQNDIIIRYLENNAETMKHNKMTQIFQLKILGQFSVN